MLNSSKLKSASSPSTLISHNPSISKSNHSGYSNKSIILGQKRQFSEVEGSNVAPESRPFLEMQANPKNLLERALRNCVNLQIPLSLVDADCALVSLNNQRGIEGEDDGRKMVKNAWFIKALCHFQQGLYDLAVKDCDFALQCDSQFSAAQVLRAISSLNLGVVGGLASSNFSSLAESAFQDLSQSLWSDNCNSPFLFHSNYRTKF